MSERREQQQQEQQQLTIAATTTTPPPLSNHSRHSFVQEAVVAEDVLSIRSAERRIQLLNDVVSIRSGRVATPQIYTYSRYWIEVNSLVPAIEGSLDEGDKCRFWPPL
jgi:uncharacterized surface protein with fasciclin (FAS1) repeats